MRDNKKITLLRVIGFIQVFLFYAICLYPFESKSGPQIPHLDKIIHLSAYLWLGNWFKGLYRSKQNVLVVLIFMGLSIEFLQHFTTYRSAEFLDVIANISGLLIGIYIVPKSWFFKINYSSSPES